MSDQGDWLGQMAKLQQQYWEGWRGLAGQVMEPARPPASPGSPWADGLEAWRRALIAQSGGMAGAMPGGFPGGFAGRDQNALFEQMMAHGKHYLGLLQGLMNAGAMQAPGGGIDPQAFVAEMRRVHERFGAGALAGLGQPHWFGGFDAGQVEQLVRSLASGPMQAVSGDLGGLLSLPAFGPQREHVERGQALARAWLDYQAAAVRFREVMLKATGGALDRFEAKLAEREQPGRQIETVRALYDLWIDAAEEAFAEVALGPDYREASGALVDAQMRVRSGINAEIERLGAQLGLPGRTEVDSMARQLHEHRRELRRLRAEIDALRRGGSSAGPAGKGGTDDAAAKPATKPAAAAKPAAGTPAKAGKARSKSKAARATRARGAETPVVRSTARSPRRSR
ncbi:MAG: hypothetical protein KF823_15425 [Xanthomonadales bacterium]|nr:hypothetical protein [Xanthomonadales bacterium]